MTPSVKKITLHIPMKLIRSWRVGATRKMVHRLLENADDLEQLQDMAAQEIAAILPRRKR